MTALPTAAGSGSIAVHGEGRPLRIAVLVKQVPRFEELELGEDGRLVRDQVDLELNPYCRRAVTAAVELAQQTGGSTVAFTLGPPPAEDVLREAIAGGVDRGVHVCDPAFAGSDTLATARALAAAIRSHGAFDVVLVGRNSVDADTGQVGPQVAELLDLGFMGAVRTLELDGTTAVARLELDDGWAVAEGTLPLAISCAERLCDPCKQSPDQRASVDPASITVLRAEALGSGPWGAAGSPTRVEQIRPRRVSRQRVVLDGPVADQVAEAVRRLRTEGALSASGPLDVSRRTVPPGRYERDVPTIGVYLEPGQPAVSAELLGAAAELAREIDGTVTAVAPGLASDLSQLGSWGADRVMLIDRAWEADDIAAASVRWCDHKTPWVLLLPSTMWGREVAGRLAARIGAGLTGDAIDLEVADGRLVSWKPALGGQLVAAITTASEIQMVTVRPGVLPKLTPRVSDAIAVGTLPASARRRVRIVERAYEDDLDELGSASVVVGVGGAVHPERYGELNPLLDALGASTAATRRVTDRGWMARSRQVGITGRSIQPSLYIALGIAGRFNHMCGVRAAGRILAVNSDPDAEVFEACDVGIVADWGEAVALLADALRDPTPATLPS